MTTYCCIANQFQSLWKSPLKLLHRKVVLMELSAHLADALLNDFVGLPLILEHLLHQVKLALHEAARAQR